MLGASGCQEPPSYRLRWSIEGRDMLDTAACAESGMLEVRVRAYDGAGAIDYADERLFSCFPSAFQDPDGTVGGSALPPGLYAIELRGIDRTATPWDVQEQSLEPNAPTHPGCRPVRDTPECRPGELVCDCRSLAVVERGAAPPEGASVVVEEGDTVDLLDLVLVAPPECIDGIDNDHDGMVDRADPSCLVDFGDGSEGVPVGVTELNLGLTLFEGNPAASCGASPVRLLELSYVGDAGPEVVLTEPCRLDQPYRASLRLPSGTTTFSVRGLDNRAPDEPAEPVTVAKTFEAQVSPTRGTVIVTVDFGYADFLAPIVGEIRAAPAYVSALGTEADPLLSAQPFPGGL